MRITTVSLLILTLISAAQAQISPPKTTIRPVENPSMVFGTGWTKIEIFPTQRVSISTNSVGIKMMEGRKSSEASRLSPISPVLVFNHAYQQFGYATGEIAFKFKDGKSLAMVKSIVPGAKAVGTQFYVVNVQTPADILSMTERLKGRTDIDWVIPTVNYLPLQSQGRE